MHVEKHDHSELVEEGGEQWYEYKWYLYSKVYRVQNTFILSYPILQQCFLETGTTRTCAEFIFSMEFLLLQIKILSSFEKLQSEINVLLGSSGNFISMCFLVFLNYYLSINKELWKGIL